MIVSSLWNLVIVSSHWSSVRTSTWIWVTRLNSVRFQSKPLLTSFTANHKLKRIAVMPMLMEQPQKIRKTKQKYRFQSKNILKFRLNLQVLPNYHGKSNKSLNQSLMDIYEKAHHWSSRLFSDNLWYFLCYINYWL